MAKSPTLCVFARRPERGKVKTRLASEIGDAAALAAYEDCLRAVAKIAARGKQNDAARQVRVFATPDGSASALEVFFSGAAFEDQGSGDLGARMLRAFEKCAPAVLIGTDSPDLPEAHVERAFADLATHDLVLGPAEDGGYVLIGMPRALPGVFRDIPWSTAAVMERTLERARALNVSVLPPWYDVDTKADLERWKRGR